jgi:predicted RecA/RadA family phage recombinase
MAANRKSSADHLPIASASANIASGALVVQEGLIGVALKAITSGAGGTIASEGVWNLVVPAGTVKGDLLYVPGAPASEDAAPVLTKTSSANTLIGVAITARHATTLKADVRLFGAVPFASTAPADYLAGAANGYKIARGEGTLDGSNPTPIATGLTTVVAVVATLKGTAAPAVGTSVLTVNISGTTANVYAWKPTGAGDTNLIASTGTESFYWIAVGT